MNGDVTWLGEYREEGVVYFRIGRHGDELVAEWPEIATLRADTVAGTSRFEAKPGADPELVEKVHASLARALLRHLEHKLTLHGSAVVKGARAVAIVGGSGSGKSTLAAALAREPGFAFAADDTLALELADDGEHGAVSLVPTETASWLLPDACAALGVEAGDDKRAVAPPSLAPPAGAQLLAIVLPAFHDDAANGEITLARVRGADVLASLVPAVVRFVIDDPRVQLREVEQLQRLAGAVPIYALRRPRDLARLAHAVRAVRALIDEAA